MSVDAPGSGPNGSQNGSQVHSFRTYDPRLEPIAAKVMAEERLSAEDALTLYGTRDVLAVGWLANHVRDRKSVV